VSHYVVVPLASPRARIAVLLVVVVALALAAHFSGLTESLTRARIAEIASSWGLAGIAAYVVLFALGELVQLPGAIFVLAAVAAYGPYVGTAVAYVGMNAAALAVFVFGRRIAGSALAEIEHPRVRALVREVAERPIRAAAFARGVLFVLPGVGYALALSSIRLREYVVGSAIGLVVPTLLAGVLGEWVLSLVS
jgi:uncharacterized membrane protein YdjX (TVP38/TMEM64 family)